MDADGVLDGEDEEAFEEDHPEMKLEKNELVELWAARSTMPL